MRKLYEISCEAGWGPGGSGRAPHRSALRIAWLVLPAALCLVFASGCKPKYPNCKKDSHCREGEFCVGNLCQQCRGDGDCESGFVCLDGACGPSDGYCRTADECGEGQVCRGNLCGPCLSASDCAEGRVCSKGSCIVAECHGTDECPAGLSCVDYRCKVDQVSAAGIGGCKLEPVYFDFDSTDVDRAMRDVLERNFSCLTGNDQRLTFEGHCDARGTTEYNMGLGDRRARTVKKLLMRMGIDPARTRVISKGEEEATGSGEAGWREDRRVDFE